MKFSSGDKLCVAKGLKVISYTDVTALVKNPKKVAVTKEQYLSMTVNERSELKKSQAYFITSAAKTRSSNAVKSAGLTAIVSDLDSTSKNIAEVKERLLAVGLGQFCVYTSISHSGEQPRYRVIVPFAEKAKLASWEIFARYLNEALFAEADDCSKTMAQAWLLPVCLVDAEYDSVIFDNGEALDINDENHPFVAAAIAYDSMVKESISAAVVYKPKLDLAEGELSPIDVYNQTYHLRGVMEQYGYIFKSKNLAVHPNSQSGSAGIYIFPSGERAFSHHGSDKYCGKSFDAFDLYVEFEHNGKFAEAFKTAAGTLRTDEGLTVTEHNRKLHQKAKAYKAMPEVSIRIIDGCFEEYEVPDAQFKFENSDITPPPPHCFDFSGIGKDILEHIINTSIYAQPTFALASTFAILAMLSGGRLTGTKTRVRANIMFICVGDSGCGKQHHINKVEEITRLIDKGLSSQVQNRFASGPAFWQFLSHNSAEMLLLADECGFLFSAMKNNKGDYQAQLYDCLLQGYSASSAVLKPTVYANLERNSEDVIEYPHINLMGFTTATTLGDALSHEDSSTGLLPRLLLVPAQYDVPEKQNFSCERFNEEALSGFKLAFRFTNWKGHLPYSRKYPLHVPTTRDAEHLLDTFGVENRKAMRTAESMERSLLNRAEENARRLSLIYWMDNIYPTDGDGQFLEENKIQVEHVQKAIDFVKWSINYTLSFMADEAGATTTSKEVERIIAMVRQAKMYGETRKDRQFNVHREALKKGYMHRSVLVKLSKKSAKYLDGLLETAGEMEAIGKYIDPSSGKVYYVAL